MATSFGECPWLLEIKNSNSALATLDLQDHLLAAPNNGIGREDPEIPNGDSGGDKMVYLFRTDGRWYRSSSELEKCLF